MVKTRVFSDQWDPRIPKVFFSLLSRMSKRNPTNILVSYFQTSPCASYFSMGLEHIGTTYHSRPRMKFPGRNAVAPAFIVDVVAPDFVYI